MRRREFVAGVGSAALVWPVAARAQVTMPVIGFLNTGSPEPFADYMRAFRSGLHAVGFVEGRNVAIEYRWADGNSALLKEMAADLVRQRVDVIAATGGSPAALAAKAATTTVPIVFQVGVDPVGIGLVSSITKPGGNLTGATIMAADLFPKRLQLLRELLPKAGTFAVLVNPTSPGAQIQLRELNAAAATLALRIEVRHASTDAQIEEVFKAVADGGAQGMVVGADPFWNAKTALLAAQALKHRVPAIYQSRSFATAGGLLSYGGNVSDAYYQVGVYSGRVLKGDKTADLPVHQSTKVELIVNLKTAKTLSVDVPLSLLGRADEMIE